MRVLAAIDFGPGTDLVLSIAARRARESRGELGVCHVFAASRPLHVLFPERELPTVGAIPGVAIEARAALEATVARVLGANADVTLFLEEGEPYAEVVRRAEEWKAELVVVAGRTARGIFASLIGGVAERIVRYAPCPVIVARCLREHGRVLAATDLSDPSLPAVAAGWAEARLRGGGLTILHVVPLVPMVSGSAPGAPPMAITPETMSAIEASTRSVFESRLATLLAPLQREEQPLEATREIVVGPPAAMIVAHARSVDAELVVVGTRGRTGLARVVLGSVAEDVVRTAECSVMVVRLAG